MIAYQNLREMLELALQGAEESTGEKREYWLGQAAKLRAELARYA